MRDRLTQTLYRLEELDRTDRNPTLLRRLDGRAKLSVTILYLIAMLSVSLTHLSELLLFALYPIITAAVGGFRYGMILRRSLVVVPFVAFIGLFNIFQAREPLFGIGPMTVTVGWATFISILLRGLLSAQALLLLIYSTGYYRICRSLQQLGVPELLTTQLLFVHRYLCVLIRESIALSMARDARSFGRRGYPLRTWGTLICQLLLRTFDRADRIGLAMAARGFTGRIPALPGARTCWQTIDTLYLAGWSLVFIGLRSVSPEQFL
ncbi:MAG: cobalt ECF transporter T component CbiQ [Alistipes sp.]|nr:cobalt ECF transporter T component CbiQ [Alistipes sp.]